MMRVESGASPGRARRPDSAAVQAAEHQQAGEKRVEQVERRRTQKERQEEQPPVNAPDREGPMQRLADGS